MLGFDKFTRFDNFPRLRFNEELPIIKMGENELEATESLSECQGVFDK